MNQAATIIFAKMVEFACLNPQEQPSAFANRVSPGTTATPRCRRVQKIRASMTLIAQKILPVAQVKLITCFHDSWIYEFTIFFHETFFVFLQGRSFLLRSQIQL